MRWPTHCLIDYVDMDPIHNKHTLEQDVLLMHMPDFVRHWGQLRKYLLLNQ